MAGRNHVYPGFCFSLNSVNSVNINSVKYVGGIIWEKCSIILSTAYLYSVFSLSPFLMRRIFSSGHGV